MTILATSATSVDLDAILDLRTLTPRERHTAIFGQFDRLLPGQALQLLADQDPRLLRFQLDDRVRGQFDWAELEAGPQQWRIRVLRTAPARPRDAAGSCCSGGNCG